MISDTHGKHEELGILSGDVLVHSGDFCNGFEIDEADLLGLDRWFGEQRFDRILCVGGNHDFAAQAKRARGERVFENAVYLEDDVCEFDGVKFYGAPWIPELEEWAYYLPDHDRQNKWSQIPADTDVLITHCPPHGILDQTSGGMSVGCRFLRDAVNGLSLKVHCFGHVHSGHGQKRQAMTLFCNAAVAGHDYDIEHSPIVVDLLI
jgi:Icc-related predicted phosphoesterase